MSINIVSNIPKCCFRSLGWLAATMSKVHRCHTDEIYVVDFVPSYLIPKKRDAGGVIYKECLYQLPIITIILVSDCKADFLMKRSL